MTRTQVETGGARARGARLSRWALAAALLATACAAPAPEDPRPSLLLVVFDTLRTDAVSAYGAPPGTTPVLDDLAARGLRYARAYAPSGWTLPSHASLFTGLRPDQHGVGTQGRFVLAEDAVTLAERLRDAGYETVGFSENPFLSEPFGLDQGFERYRSFTIAEAMRPDLRNLDLPALVGEWAAERRPGRPFFLFLNFVDTHEPYRLHPGTRFLPAGVDAREAAAVVQSTRRICADLPPPNELEILRGLYLGEAAFADAKLGRILAALRDAGLADGLVTIATADHGEHLGEHRLLDHQYSLRNVLLHVPLVVQGLPGVAPGVIEASVELADVAPSVLAWAGEQVAPGLAGRPLPVSPDETSPERGLAGVYHDLPPRDWPASLEIPIVDPVPKRAACGPDDRVFGSMLSWTRYPYKLLWFTRYPAELYDLRWDALERSDLAKLQPEIAARLERELLDWAGPAGLLAPAPGATELTPEVRRALEELGYLE